MGQVAHDKRLVINLVIVHIMSIHQGPTTHFSPMHIRLHELKWEVTMLIQLERHALVVGKRVILPLHVPTRTPVLLQ